MPKDIPIALGFGDDIDYEIEFDKNIFENLISQYNISAKDIHDFIPVTSTKQLIASILYFMQTETGGERFVSDIVLIEEFSKYFEYRKTIGGTSPRAAISMSKLGYDSILHLVTINNDIRRLLPPNTSYVCSNDRDTLYPHLIIQFNQNIHIKVGDIDIKPSRANRIIYDKDSDNIALKINPDFFNKIRNSKILLFSGFNAINDLALLEERLLSIKSKIEPLIGSVKMFYEDACFSNREFTKIVWKYLVPYVDFYSMNEDELQYYIEKKVNLLDAEKILDALKHISSIVDTPVLILHTKFYALAYCKHNMQGLREALVEGVTMATTRFRFGDNFEKVDFLQTKKLSYEKEGLDFARDIESQCDKIICVPSFDVKETNVTTVGLGDSFVGGILPALINVN